MLANYQAKVERKVLQLPPDLAPDEKLAAIAEILVGSCPKPKTKTSFTTAPDTEVDGALSYGRTCSTYGRS